MDCSILCKLRNCLADYPGNQRRWHQLDWLKYSKKTVREIQPKEKTIRITLDDIPAHIYRGINLGEVRKQCSDAVHFEIKANVIKDGETKTASTSKIDALTREFKQFLEKQDIKDKETLMELGIGYIEKIEARDEGK